MLCTLFLHHAITHAFNLESDFSILVDEGMYVDPFECIPIPDGCKVEILGMGNVFIILLKSKAFTMSIRGNLTLWNIFLLNQQHSFGLYQLMDVNGGTPLLVISERALVLLYLVTIQASNKVVIVVYGQGSEVLMVNSFIKHSIIGFHLLSGAKMTFSAGSRFSDLSFHCCEVADGSDLSNVSFTSVISG